MLEGPLFNLFAFAAGLYLLHLWRSDARALATEGIEARGLLPGCTPASLHACLIAMLGALLIIGAVTWIEVEWDLLQSQRTISPWFLGAMMGAAITEELIFRGYLIVQHRGWMALIASAIGFSLLFAMLHPYLWTHHIDQPSGLQWITALRIDGAPENLLAAASIFVLSLWFYTVRFAPFNPGHSLLPCFCAHAAANLAVFLIKLATGHVS